MPGLRLVVLPLATLAAAGLVVPAASLAQDSASVPCRLCSDQASNDAKNARPAQPLRLEVETRLDFDKVVFGGNGSAVLKLSPTGTATLLGSASAQGSRAMPGTVTVRGEPGRAVRIDLPRQVELHGAGNGSLRLDSLVTDLPSFPVIGVDGTLSFRFGGDLRLSGDSDGAYHGTVDIVVDYL